QTWFGSFREDLLVWSQQYKNPDKAIELLSCFENIRLIFCIKNELPGFYRQFTPLCQPLLTLSDKQPWKSIFSQLEEKSDIASSFKLVNQYLNKLTPVKTVYQGIINPAVLNNVIQKRFEKEKTLFKNMLGEIVDEKINEQDISKQTVTEKQFSTKINNDDIVNDMSIDLFLDGEKIQISEQMQSLLDSIIQDMGNLPPEYLQAAGPGAYHPKKAEEEKSSVWGGTYHENDAFFYDEWDLLRKGYKKNWCVVREMGVTPVYDNFVADTLQKHRGLVKSIRRTFEALRGEEKLLKKQLQGDDIDIDAVVDGFTDMQAGMEMPDRLFTQMQKNERNIAVVFMVDMSGSTKGWINDAERESLVLLCEALEIMGDRYAIYGFSGIARKRCEIFRIKRFDEPYNDKVKARISGISAKDYTRMGFAIRHLTQLLEEIEAKTKLLITLSDGKPEDYDGQYRGEYGIEDTRQALFEAKQKGIHAFCITIDEQAGDYLPHMYGAANYTVINEVAKLPLKVSEIYRKITTK
ncbi:MAG: nitric oxide reductase activation protein, partial [Pseudomonadota bacterium]